MDVGFKRFSIPNRLFWGLVVISTNQVSPFVLQHGSWIACLTALVLCRFWCRRNLLLWPACDLVYTPRVCVPVWKCEGISHQLFWFRAEITFFNDCIDFRRFPWYACVCARARIWWQCGMFVVVVAFLNKPAPVSSTRERNRSKRKNTVPSGYWQHCLKTEYVSFSTLNKPLLKVYRFYYANYDLISACGN